MKDKIIKNGMSEIYVTESGDSRKQTIVFVHGFPDCHKTWSKQIEYFSNSYHVVAFDTRGVGKSTWHGDKSGYKIDEMHKDFECVIKEYCKNGKKVHLVAHDWGSALCWRFIHNPEYLKYIKSYTSLSAPDPKIYNFWMKKQIKDGNYKNFFKQFFMSWYITLFLILPYPLIRTILNDNNIRLLISWLGMEKDDDYLYRDFKSGKYMNHLALYKENVFDLLRSDSEIDEFPDIPLHVIVLEKDKALSVEIITYCGELNPSIKFTRLPCNHFSLNSHYKDINRAIEDGFKNDMPNLDKKENSFDSLNSLSV